MARRKNSKIPLEVLGALIASGALVAMLYFARNTTVPLAGISFGIVTTSVLSVFAQRGSGIFVDPKVKRRTQWKKLYAEMRLAGQAEKRSDLVCQRLIETEPFQSAQRVMAFACTDGEIDLTTALLEYLNAGKTVCLPRINWAKKTMVPGVITSLDNLVTYRHGILEPPEDAPTVPVEDLDLILVPGVAFDKKCNRLGRGGGFYDRFLESVPPIVKTCGVAFEAQIVKLVPTLPHDRALDAVVTESRLILRK